MFKEISRSSTTLIKVRGYVPMHVSLYLHVDHQKIKSRKTGWKNCKIYVRALLCPYCVNLCYIRERLFSTGYHTLRTDTKISVIAFDAAENIWIP